MDTENLRLSSSSKFRVLNAGPVCSRILCSPIAVSSGATPRSRVDRQGRVPLKKTCQFKFHGKILEKLFIDIVTYQIHTTHILINTTAKHSSFSNLLLKLSHESTYEARVKCAFIIIFVLFILFF